MGFGRINENIAVLIVCTRFRDAHLLMPAVLSAYEIGLHRKCQILMHPAVGPENSLRIRVFTLERFDTVDLAHHPFSFTHLLQIHERGRPTLAAGFFLQAPSPKMMRAGNDAGLNSLCYPY